MNKHLSTQTHCKFTKYTSVGVIVNMHIYRCLPSLSWLAFLSKMHLCVTVHLSVSVPASVSVSVSVPAAVSVSVCVLVFFAFIFLLPSYMPQKPILLNDQPHLYATRETSLDDMLCASLYEHLLSHR